MISAAPGPRRQAARITATLLLAGALLAGVRAPAAAQQSAAPSAAVLAVDSAAPAEATALGTARGTMAARNESTARWVWGGFAGGLTLGPIGAGVSYVMASNSQVAPSPAQRMVLLSEGSPEYAWAYEQAFTAALRQRRKRSAVVGGALGTAALAAVATTVWAVYYYY